MAGHKGQACENNMDCKQCRSQEQERKFNRFGNAGQERGQCNREQQRAGLLFLFRTCAYIHSQCSTRQTAHHKRILTSQETACINRELRGFRRSQLCKEDILCAHNIDAINNSRAAYAGLPERHVEDMMQTERNQCTFNTAINKGSCITGSLNQTAQCINTILDNRPYHKQDCAGYNTEYHADNRYKTGACEKGQCIRQLGFIELVAQHCCDNTGNNTAEYTHLQGLDAQYRSNCAILYGIRNLSVNNGAIQCQQDIDGCQHNQVENTGGQDGNALFFLCHAQSNCQGKNQCQIAENRITCVVQHHHQTIQQRARM